MCLSLFPVIIINTFYCADIFQYGMNETGGVGHVPPGWDQWHALVGHGDNPFLLYFKHFCHFLFFLSLLHVFQFPKKYIFW